jgi:hypothetical protein
VEAQLKKEQPMSVFKSVSPEEYSQLLDDAPASPAFRSEFARYKPGYYEGWSGPDCMVHQGDLKISGDFTAPGFYTLIVGNLVVDGHVSLQNSYDKGFDEGGLFIVIGDVRCRSFSNEYGKMTFMDGDLEAEDLILNSYEDSSLTVIGTLKTYFFYGIDIWAEVGIGAVMEYGVGYCLPIGYTDGEDQVIRPRHDEETSLSLLDFEKTSYIENEAFTDRIHEGRSVFKRR